MRKISVFSYLNKFLILWISFFAEDISKKNQNSTKSCKSITENQVYLHNFSVDDEGKLKGTVVYWTWNFLQKQQYLNIQNFVLG